MSSGGGLCATADTAKADSQSLVRRQLEADPCYAESQLSIKCLDKNNYVREKCAVHFENYKVKERTKRRLHE